jgi:transcriptional regulator with XRE-family HTH domain
MLRSVASAQPKRRFGANVRRNRLRLELSQEALAYRCGLHMTEISRLERAEREPRLATIVAIARGLEIKPAELLDGIN